MKRIFTKRVTLWPVVLIIASLVLALGAVSTLLAVPSFFALGAEVEDRNTQVVTSIIREEQVVLLSLGIQGIEEENGPVAEILGMAVPSSERASLVRYEFTGKLGIDGKDVRIEQTGEDEFLVHIPKFIFIGQDNEDFSVVTEENGVLSWMTPEIDPVEMVNTILNNQAKDQHIVANTAMLKEQATAFYGGIIEGIDPTVIVDFEFSS